MTYNFEKNRKIKVANVEVHYSIILRQFIRVGILASISGRLVGKTQYCHVNTIKFVKNLKKFGSYEVQNQKCWDIMILNWKSEPVCENHCCTINRYLCVHHLPKLKP